MIHDSSFFSHMKGMGLSVACLKVSRTPWELFRELPGGSVPSVEMAQLPRLVSSHHGSGPSIKRPSPAAPGTPGPGSREWPAHHPRGKTRVFLLLMSPEVGFFLWLDSWWIWWFKVHPDNSGELKWLVGKVLSKLSLAGAHVLLVTRVCYFQVALSKFRRGTLRIWSHRQAQQQSLYLPRLSHIAIPLHIPSRSCTSATRALCIMMLYAGLTPARLPHVWLQSLVKYWESKMTHPHIRSRRQRIEAGTTTEGKKIQGSLWVFETTTTWQNHARTF